MAKSVETAIYRLQVEGQEKIDRLAKSIDGMVTAEEDATSSNRKLTQQIQRGLTSYDAALKAQEQHNKALELNARAREAGASSLQKLDAHLGATTQNYEKATKAINEAAIATENLRRAQANAAAGPGGAVGGVGGAATYAAEFERMMTIAEGKAAQIGKNFGEELNERMVVGTRKAARDSAAAFSAELDRIDEIAHLKALQVGKNFQDTLNAQMRIGAAPGKSARKSFAVFDEAGAIPQADKHMQQLGNSTKVARYEMINLGRQANDVIVSLASGQGILTVGLQQGSQILDVFTSSERTAGEMFKQMGTSIMGFVTNPLVLAGAAVTALVTTTLALANAWDKVNVSAQRAISGAGRRTGTSVEDINRFVSQNARAGSSTGLSDVEARKLANEFTRTGDIVVSQLGRMDTAVVGFANQAGKSIDEAIKDFARFGSDPVKAMDELAKVYGPVDQKTRELVEGFAKAGDKTAALSALIRGLAGESKKAAEQMTWMESLWRRITTLAGKETVAPTGLGDQLKAAQDRLASLQAAPQFGGSGQAGMGAMRTSDIRAAREEVARLNAEMEKDSAAKYAAQMRHVAEQARQVTAELIPQIKQIEELEKKINQLKAAQAAGVGGPDNSAALTAAQNQLQVLGDSKEQAARYNERVKEIAGSWGDVGQQTALQLQAMQNQLPVAQAVGGAARMQAQYQADINDALDKGLKLTEATALAGMKRQLAQAQVNSQAKETLFSLENQAAAAGAVTGAQQMAAQAAATYNQLVHDGVDASVAAAVAAQQLANAQAAASAAVMRQVKSLEQATELLIAQENGTEAIVKASQAYQNAIESGASALSASALYAATLTNELTKAAIQADKIALAAQQKQYADAKARGAGTFNPDPTLTTHTGSSALTSAGEALRDYEISEQLGAQNQLSFSDAVALAGRGGVGAALAFAMGQQARGAAYGQDAFMAPGGAILTTPNSTVVEQAISESDIIGQVTSLYDLQRKQGGDQSASMQAELAWLQSRPQSLEQQKAIVDLKSAIEGLTKSTDSLNETNQELLSPYYTQDPRTSHIGFRSQGMASGGYVDVPGGVSANDNMLAMIPVASGERIYVDPMGAKRGVQSGGNLTINISSPVMIQGNANKDDVGRTMFQNNQNLAKQLRGAMQ